MVVARMFGVMVVGLALTFSCARAMPIPIGYDGFVNPPYSWKHNIALLEAFIDPVCPDCRTAWPILKQLLSIYGSSLLLIVHPFPVPFHTNSFFTTRALHIANTLNSSTTYLLLEHIFKSQEAFWNDVTLFEAPVDIVEKLVNLAADTGLPEEQFSRGFRDSSTDQAARISFKFGCSRGVTSTPSFLVNGVPVGADETWSVLQWRRLLDPVVKSNVDSLSTFRTSGLS